jgi:hypothetical protein
LSPYRLLVLIVGPLPILGGSLLLSRWVYSEPQGPPHGNHAVVRGQDPDTARQGRDEISPSLRRDCQVQADSLRQQLGAECAVIERPPFVLAGDLSTAELDRWYRQTIGPAARSMARAYFRTPPDKHITVLLFSKEQSYNHYAEQLFGEEGISVYGYYKPQQRTLVMNIGTGGGTLVHELTHALIDFDFPAVPDWFNEGLASLHEACRIRADESGIDGLPNWRLPGLQKAIREERLDSLSTLLASKEFRGSQVGLNYAEARYFCMYMQQQGVLVDFFRKFRSQHTHDPTGVQTVKEVFVGRSWEELDRDFRAWVLTLHWKS